MIVKKTCKNRLTAFIKTAKRYSHASPDIVTGMTKKHAARQEERRGRQIRGWRRRVHAKKPEKTMRCGEVSDAKMGEILCRRPS
jgi:hypothetical protein